MFEEVEGDLNTGSETDEETGRQSNKYRKVKKCLLIEDYLSDPNYVEALN